MTRTSVAFSPDGNLIASGSIDKTIRLWDATTGLASGPPIAGHTDTVTMVKFSSDGKRIGSGSFDKTVRIWSVVNRQPLGEPMKGHIGRIVSVSFSSDGKQIASGSLDKTVRLWPAQADDQLLCGKLASNMSRQSWRDWISAHLEYIPVCPGLPEAPG
jgi:WD40 repeat protein